MTYSASKVDQMADALAEAVEAIKPHMYEKGMIGETEYEICCLTLWKALTAYKRARAKT